MVIPPLMEYPIKKPIIMVVPSDLWCNTNGYVQEMDVNGVQVIYPDYRKALMENADLMLVISKINEQMTERDFPLKNLESALKNPGRLRSGIFYFACAACPQS